MISCAYYVCMNQIETATYEAPTWSSASCWRAYAIINGTRTTLVCGHSHSRQDLAERCAAKGFSAEIAPLVTAEITELHTDLVQARWIDDNGTQRFFHFRYLPTR